MSVNVRHRGTLKDHPQVKPFNVHVEYNVSVQQLYFLLEGPDISI